MSVPTSAPPTTIRRPLVTCPSCGQLYRSVPTNRIPVCDRCLVEMEHDSWEALRDKLAAANYR